MLLVGLTGGIGSGKSTVAQMLSDRGAVILDADEFAREALQPGSPESSRAAARFGQPAIDDSGNIDRKVLAEIVFNDDQARRDLEEIVHPFVIRRIGEEIQANAGADRVVVLVSPLLFEMGTNDACDFVVVVTAEPDTRLQRLITRGMEETDARARMDVQAAAEDRASAADFVLDNDGPIEDLALQVERLWASLTSSAGSD